MAVERKSSIRKAPAADVVDVLTSRIVEAAPLTAAALTTRSEPPQVDANPVVVTRGPGPGRPRSKKRMEPFSSKIEISLRDELDSYIQSSGITIIEFLDEAIRDRLKK
jgi:hypothetical protein